MNSKLAIAALALAACCPAHAQVYKCTSGGVTSFTDRPCDSAAQPIVIRPASGAAQPGAESGQSDYIEQSRTVTQRRVITNQIEVKQRRIAGLRQSRDRELAAVKARQEQAPKTLTDATAMQAVMQEMQSINARYDAEIRIEQAEIDRLIQERAEIN